MREDLVDHTGSLEEEELRIRGTFWIKSLMWRSRGRAEERCMWKRV
jgi:hypothetical protein